MKRMIPILLAALFLLCAGCEQRKKVTIPESGPEQVEPAVPEAPVEPAEPETPVEPEQPSAPQAQGELVFDTVTLYGEAISSDMIRDYDLVLVNFWADWCGWCVYEMPELERIHQEYPNVLMLGVLSFPNSMDDSLQILKENNITFLTLEPDGTLVDMANGLEAFPTTMFFDRNGNSIGEPVVGAQDYDGWKATVENMLAGEPIEPEQPAVPDEPEAPQAQGDLVFDTVTLSGEPIGSDMIRDYDLIMVNFWAEWCGPCVGEMPEIERIHEAYPNVLILGVWIGDDLNGAKDVIADSGVTYPTLGVSGTLEKYSGMSMYIPATYFFDRNGNEIGEPVIGSQDYEGWKATVEALLP